MLTLLYLCGRQPSNLCGNSKMAKICYYFSHQYHLQKQEWGRASVTRLTIQNIIIHNCGMNGSITEEVINS